MIRVKSAPLQLGAAAIGVLLLTACGQAARVPAPLAPVQATIRDDIPSGPAVANLRASAQVNTELAAAYLQAGRHTVAKEVVADALAANPHSPVALAIQGLIYGELRDYINGDESFAKAFRLTDHDPDLNHNFGLYLCRTGRPSKAIAYFEQAIQVPGYARLNASRAALGYCLMKLARTDEAEAQFASIYDADHNNPAAALGLAEVALEQRKYQAARKHLSRYATVARPSAQSLWLNREVEKAIGTVTEVNGLTADLLRLFPDSEQASKVSSIEISESRTK